MGNIIQKIIDKFSKRVNKKLKQGGIFSTLLYENNHVDLIYNICSKNKIDFNDKIDYIENVIKSDEELLNHSNIILYMEIMKNEYTKELLELISISKYINLKTILDEDKEIVHIFLTGSIKGFKYIIKNCSNLDNKLCQNIIETLYLTDSCYFYDLIEEGIMNEFKFLNTPVPNDFSKISSLYYDIDNIDSIIIDNNKDIFSVLSLKDILDMSTITITFKNISSCYIEKYLFNCIGKSEIKLNYRFNSPSMFNKDDNKYEIKIKDEKFKDGVCFNFSQRELGDMLMDIHNQLSDKGLTDNDLLNYIPNGVGASFTVTLSIIDFIKLIETDTDINEIKTVLNSLKNTFDEFKSKLNISDSEYNNLFISNYKKYADNEKLYSEIDEIIE